MQRSIQIDADDSAEWFLLRVIQIGEGQVSI